MTQIAAIAFVVFMTLGGIPTQTMLPYQAEPDGACQDAGDSDSDKEDGSKSSDTSADKTDRDKAAKGKNAEAKKSKKADGTDEPSEEELEQLRSLGYVE